MNATVNAKRPFAQDFSGESKTQQHFKDSCDVNNIVAHYQQTGVDPYADRRASQQFGFATSETYESAMRNVAEVNSAFAALPSEERALHLHDPARWLSAQASPEVEDPENSPPEPPQEPTPDPVPVPAPPSNGGANG